MGNELDFISQTIVKRFLIINVDKSPELIKAWDLKPEDQKFQIRKLTIEDKFSNNSEDRYFAISKVTYQTGIEEDLLPPKDHILIVAMNNLGQLKQIDNYYLLLKFQFLLNHEYVDYQGFCSDNLNVCAFALFRNEKIDFYEFCVRMKMFAHVEFFDDNFPSDFLYQDDIIPHNYIPDLEQKTIKGQLRWVEYYKENPCKDYENWPEVKYFTKHFASECKKIEKL
jgi:hypothetical protein